MRSSRHVLDWPNQPLPFKIYSSLEPMALPLTFSPSAVPALQAISGACAASTLALDVEMLARLCYFSTGITRVLRGMPFRAAACTGALYHVELYLICGDLPGLEAGVYHYGAHDHALRRLRSGDYRGLLRHATGNERHVGAAPVIAALTSTWWRNAWKYQARAYRHAFWDTGTIVANLLGVACANGVASRVVVGFVDADLNRLLDIEPTQEATICLVALGSGSAPPAAGDWPAVVPLGLPTRPLSAHRVDYPLIVEAHGASSLASADDVVAWRRAAPPRSEAPAGVEPIGGSIEQVIARRGSSRRFSHQPIGRRELELMLLAATTPIPCDAPVLTRPYLIVNAVGGLEPGAYVFDREGARPALLRSGSFRREAAFLDLGQELAGDAAVNVYWLAAFEHDRDYRAAQLEAAIEGGKLYLAAYALGLGATGLTFFDDEVTRFFSPQAAGKAVMFLTAVGHPARRAERVLSGC